MMHLMRLCTSNDALAADGFGGDAFAAQVGD
jgi:hypothetical protein